jgi:hypothetical protein
MGDSRQPSKIAKREMESITLKQSLTTALMTIWCLCNPNPSPNPSSSSSTQDSICDAGAGGSSRTQVPMAIDRTKVEVEVRLGMILQGGCRWHDQTPSDAVAIFDDERRVQQRLEFCAGVDKIFLIQHLQSKILTERNDFKQVTQPMQRMRSISSALRWEVITDKDGSTRIQIPESKERFFRWNLGLLSHEYDLRIDGAVERQVGPHNARYMDSIDYERDWTQERIKHRSTYSSRRYPYWKIDVTEVHSINRLKAPSRPALDSSPSIDYEFEIELENGCATEWLMTASKAAAEQYAMQLADSLEKLIDLCVPSQEGGSDGLVMERVSSNDYKKELKRINDTVLWRDTTNDSPAFEFLGSMPFNMSRKTLELVKNEDYRVTEKSDGVRYLMYVIEVSGQAMAVFVDRSKEIFQLASSRYLGKIFKIGTVFDCEVVYNKTYKAQMILVFDVLAIDSRSYVNTLFQERLALLDGLINNRIADYIRLIQGPDIPPGNHVKFIARKKYLSKHELSALLSMIRYENGERVYCEPDGRRHHKTDGIIFQPADKPYQFFSDANLLKWKWPDLRTVDLIAMVDHFTAVTAEQPYPSISLSCSGPDNVPIDCTKRGGSSAGLARFDSYRLLADISAPHLPPINQKPRVVEVMYDSSFGQWKYFRFRQDKSKPNFIDTVMSVFIEQAEDISIEELEYSILAAPSRPSFRSLVLNKMQRLVDEVRLERKDGHSKR